MINVLFAASEAVPFIKTGGLADVCGSLPSAFNAKDFDVRVVIPKYLCIDESLRNTAKYKFRFYVDLGWRKQYVGVFEAFYRGIHFYLLDNEYYFGGDCPYHLIHEDIEKFAFFSKAVIESIPLLDFTPDIIHCHDWQTALIPVYLKTCYRDNPALSSIKTVFTIHNLRFQGRFDLKTVRDITGLPDYMFTADKLEFYGEGNYLKGGILYSDKVTTVSQTYAKEITTQEGGEGLDGVLKMRGNDLSGILNGIDDIEFDPATDPHISCRYTTNTILSGKHQNKSFLQKKSGLPVRDKSMVLGIVSRLTDQKGFDLIAAILEDLLGKMDIQIVTLGTGEERYESMLKHFAERFPDKMAVNACYSEELAHQIYAGCDAFLMPSLFEPCGLSQLISMRYGTVPIVRETGGLKDTVEPYNEFEGTGTGFSFANYNADELLYSIKYAFRVFSHHSDEWKALCIRCMEQDFSWKQSAREYEKLYMSIL